MSRSQELYERAQKVTPGGVNSPVRAFKSVGGDPLFIKAARGCYLEDVDSKRYIDYVGSWGPMILGHGDEDVKAAILQAAEFGVSFGAPTELEVLFAEAICQSVPAVEKVRFVSSGTEAAMSALRVARGFTGRDAVIKFDGCYHGHSDGLLVGAGSGVATNAISGSKGVPQAFINSTYSVPFNSLDAVEQAFQKAGPENVAVVAIEPVAGNMGMVLPNKGFLKGLREICDLHGALLLFDEVMTGFRCGLSGAGHRLGVTADLYCFGKIIGGGLPVGAFGGRADIMDCLSPEGEVYQAGTLSGCPLAMAAGLSTLSKLIELNPYSELEDMGEKLISGLGEIACKFGHSVSGAALGGMCGYFFTDKEVQNFEDAKAADTEFFKKFFWQMLEQGVYLPPSPFEACFMSVCHSTEVIENTLDSAERAFQKLR